MAATDISTEGSKESRAIIKQFHVLLNGSDLIPEQAYRRNSGAHPLVCYVNNIIGLFLSKNYDPIPVFVARVTEHMAGFPPSAASSAYYAAVTRYLSQVVYHLQHFVSGIEFWDDRIPQHILDAGPQVVG
jgi:hypothetical protein